MVPSPWHLIRSRRNHIGALTLAPNPIAPPLLCPRPTLTSCLYPRTAPQPLCHLPHLGFSLPLLTTTKEERRRREKGKKGKRAGTAASGGAGGRPCHGAGPITELGVSRSRELRRDAVAGNKAKEDLGAPWTSILPFFTEPAMTPQPTQHEQAVAFIPSLPLGLNAHVTDLRAAVF